MWGIIEKDRYGFATDKCLDVLYSMLPIVVARVEEGMYPTLEYIDAENWSDAVSDFSKPEYKYWHQVSEFPFE